MNGFVYSVESAVSEITVEVKSQVEKSEIMITTEEPKPQAPETTEMVIELKPEEPQKEVAEETIELLEKTEGEAPKFIVELVSREITEGEGLTLECKVTGIPMPVEVVWYVDGVVITDEHIYDMIYTPEGVCVLTIRETFPEDEGEYMCKATNPHGTAATMCEVLIQGPRTVTLYLS